MPMRERCGISFVSPIIKIKRIILVMTVKNSLWYLITWSFYFKILLIDDSKLTGEDKMFLCGFKFYVLAPSLPCYISHCEVRGFLSIKIKAALKILLLPLSMKSFSCKVAFCLDKKSVFYRNFYYFGWYFDNNFCFSHTLGASVRG